MVKIADRLLLLIYSFIIFVLSGTMLFIAWDWVPLTESSRTLASIYHEPEVAYAVIGVSILLLLISVRFLYVSVRRSHSQAPSIDQRTEFGDIRISMDTVENLALKAAGRTRGVKDLRARVRVSQAGLEIVIRTVVDGETSIPELTEEMQGAVKSYIEEITGIPVAQVSVFVANIVATSPTFKSRVE